MIKRVVIAGCRNYNNYNEAKDYIEECLVDITKTHTVIIISGAASGADALGERFALENHLTLEKHPADWKRYGRSAGPIRNREMAELCDIVICFWDGNSKGTKSMIECAQKLKKDIFIKLI